MAAAGVKDFAKDVLGSLTRLGTHGMKEATKVAELFKEMKAAAVNVHPDFGAEIAKLREPSATLAGDRGVKFGEIKAETAVDFMKNGEFVKGFTHLSPDLGKVVEQRALHKTFTNVAEKHWLGYHVQKLAKRAKTIEDKIPAFAENPKNMDAATNELKVKNPEMYEKIVNFLTENKKTIALGTVGVTVAATGFANMEQYRKNLSGCLKYET